MTDCFVTQALVRNLGRENCSGIQITISIKGETKSVASHSILLQIPWGLLHSITILCAVINGYRGPLIEPWISINYNLITAPGPSVINRLHLQQTVMVAIEFYPIMISFLICITVAPATALLCLVLFVICTIYWAKNLSNINLLLLQYKELQS